MGRLIQNFFLACQIPSIEDCEHSQSQRAGRFAARYVHLIDIRTSTVMTHLYWKSHNPIVPGYLIALALQRAVRLIAKPWQITFVSDDGT